jgi:signal transduction histidine kinase
LKITILSIKGTEIESCLYNGIEDLDMTSLETVKEFSSVNRRCKIFEVKSSSGGKLGIVLDTSFIIEEFQAKNNEIVHEIKNILTLVVSSVLILSKLRGKKLLETKAEMVERSLGEIETSVHSVVTLLNNLKKIESYEGKEYRVRVKDFVELTTSGAETVCTDSDVQLVLNVNISEEKHTHTITTHGLILNQIVVNLIKNAIYAVTKSDKDEKKIEIDISEKSGTLRFTIQDTGLGVKAEDRDQIFEDGYTTKGDDGSGIGLFICQKAIVSSGGAMDLLEDYKNGAKFFFELPIQS